MGDENKSDAAAPGIGEPPHPPTCDLLKWAENKLARELEPEPLNERLILSLPTARKILQDIRAARAALLWAGVAPPHARHPQLKERITNDEQAHSSSLSALARPPRGDAQP